MKLFPYKKGGTYGIIDSNGSIVEASGKFGLINKNDEVVLGFDFDHINGWTANGTTALIGDTWYLIRPSLELLKFGEAHFLHPISRLSGDALAGCF